MKKSRFKDVTDEWLLEHEQEPIVIEENFYIGSYGIKYYNGDTNSDGEKYTIRSGFVNNEEENAKMISRQTGGIVYKMPEVSNPKGIRTADFRQEYETTRLIEQKEIDKTSTSNNAIFYQAKRAKGQSDKVIIDLHNRFFSDETILEQTKKIFKESSTSFVKTIIYTKDGRNIWKIFQRKK